MRHYDRFIPGEEIADVKQWQFGAIDTTAQLLAARAKASEDQEAQAKAEVDQQQAYQAGYAEGVVQGRAQAQLELQQQMQDFMNTQAQAAGQRLSQLFESAQDQLAQAEQAMAQEVLALACELARQVLRHELTVNPTVVMPVLTEAIDLLGADHKTAVVKLHPQDLEALGEQIHASFNGLNLSVRADPDVLPGGCLVESAGTVVDGTVQKRWRRAVATLGLSSQWEEPGESR
ncbi:FliH/SctL family protein [Rhodoferax sp.]|uniref:FliH/SctL family protein n=1 Tax=Rhodoferax sp. TaxID=50421 RepID=UPI00262A0A53|nr:FliH/SctL family protein [Rhodoferax sp.]MDD2925554.1 FliH/SctL family protein [Rhodoferax sp.]